MFAGNYLQKQFQQLYLKAILRGVKRISFGMQIPFRKDATMAANESKDSDLQKIQDLIKIMEQSGLIELEIAKGPDKIYLKRSSAEEPIVSGRMVGGKPSKQIPDLSNQQVSETGAAPKDEDLVEITSPLVGTFYSAPSPDSEPYVEVGSAVEPQMVVCIIEAMKVMNEIKSETGGTIAEILVTNGQAVEYGQVLFRVKPD
jgi:acetyl-CoA carboxylase biotin carboxyl carrier protein